MPPTKPTPSRARRADAPGGAARAVGGRGAPGVEGSAPPSEGRLGYPARFGVGEPGPIEALCDRLRARPRRWLLTGAAGFIGSHLLEALLALDQPVVGLDDFSTGRQANLDAVRAAVGERRFARLRMLRGDLRDAAVVARACRGAELVLHQAALGSVPRSLAAPLETQAVNVGGSLRLMQAAREAGVRRLVYASSSSVYGDLERLPMREGRLGNPLSPYALSKRAVELLAESMRGRGPALVGLRYFNVVGPRQREDGPYAAVVPRWVAALARGERPRMNGDGQRTRDFTPVENVVQACLLAAVRPGVEGCFNVATGRGTSLSELEGLLHSAFERHGLPCGHLAAERGSVRAGDLAHSLADIGAARARLGYRPRRALAESLDEIVAAAIDPTRATVKPLSSASG